MSKTENPFSRLTWKELSSEDFINDLLALPEGPFLEFKARLPKLSETAKLLAAFRNSGGGLLIIGVDESAQLLGIPPDTDLARHLDAATQLLSKDDGNTLNGITPYRGKYLGIVRESGYAIDPCQPITFDDKIVKRIGTVTAYLTPREYRDSISLALDPEPLQLSDSDIRQFLSCASEDVLTELLIVPLLRFIGFESVFPKGHKDKSLEFGQDIRGFKFRLPTGDWLYFASQVKHGPVSSSAAEPSRNVAKLFTQVQMAFGAEVFDPQTNSYHQVNHVVIVASGDVSAGAQEYIHRELSRDTRPGRVIWIDGNRLLELAQRCGLPAGVQSDIGVYLRALNERED